MKFVIEIQNPQRPVEYVGTRGFAANKSEARIFQTQHDLVDWTCHLEEFCHLDDSFHWMPL